MGGEGSGRKPDVVGMMHVQEKNTLNMAPQMELPNYSGLQNVKKADTPVLKTESDPVFVALSGGLPYLPTSLSGSSTQPEQSIIFISGGKFYGQTNLLSFSGGFVGIGTTAPDVNLHLYGTGPIIKMELNDTSVATGQNVGLLGFNGGEDGAGSQVAYIIAEADATWTSTSSPTHFSFGVTQAGNITTTKTALIAEDGIHLLNTTDTTPGIQLSGCFFVSGGAGFYRGDKGTITLIGAR